MTCCHKERRYIPGLIRIGFMTEGTWTLKLRLFRAYSVRNESEGNLRKGKPYCQRLLFSLLIKHFLSTNSAYL